MTDQSVFNAQATTPNNPESAPEGNGQPVQFDELLQSIKRDDGSQKFTDVGSALQAIPHQQAHISTIESENAKMREEMEQLKVELAKRKSVEETVANLTQQTKTATPASEFDPSQVVNIVSDVINQRETATVREQNLGVVINTFSQKFGDKAEEVFYKGAQELGMSRDEINQLAAKNPQAVFKMLGVDTPRNQTQSMQSSVNTEALSNSNQPQPLNAKMQGTRTEHAIDAWRRAGEIVKSQ